MNDDAALLRRFVDERSETAFTELVRRHLDLVYAIGLRRTNGDSTRAADLTQDAFLQLAREAAAVSRRCIIVGWLYATARRAGGSAAVAPHSSEGAQSGNPDDPGSSPRAAGWDPVCDDILDELAENDRSALLLHFFERRPLAEVGGALSLSEEAAGLSTRRAVDKWRAAAARRGLRFSQTTVNALMTSQAVAPAPAGLADRVINTTVAAAAVAEIADDGRPGFLASIIRLVNSGALLGTVAVAALGGALAWGYRTNTRLEAEIARLRGDSQVLAGLQRDNRRLARLVAEAEELRRELAELPLLRAAVHPPGPAPATGTASITVAPEGTFRWDNDDVSPAELIQRLRDFRARFPGGDSSLTVRGAGASFSAITYVLDEIRKARITQVIVDGEPRPDAGAGGWF